MLVEIAAGMKTVDEPEVLRARAIMLGLVLIPFNSYWVAFMESIRYTGHPTTYSLYFNVVFILFLLVGINEALRRFLPRLCLSRAELVVVYFMLALASALVGHDQAQVLLSLIGYPYYFNRPELGWDNTFMPLLPKQLYVSDETALLHLYTGGKSLWDPENFGAWIQALSWWGGFTLALLAVMFGLCVVFRRQWSINEKLAFPLVKLPIEMASEGAELWRNKALWGAMLAPAFINTLSNLHLMYPAVPELNIRQINLDQYFSTRPWTALGWTPVTFFPFAIGVGFLLPLDLLLSSWFFYGFWKTQRIVVAMLGYSVGQGQPPYPAEQSFGAYLGVALFALWAARMHFKNVWLAVIGKGGTEAAEAWRLRLAAVAIGGGLAALIWFSATNGMDELSAVLFFVLYYLISITVGRLRGEFGAPVHDLHFADPGYIMTQVAGTAPFSPKTLIMFSNYFWFNRAHRSDPMPVLLEGIVSGDQLRTRRTTLLVALGLAAVVGLISAYWALLQQYYDLGAGTAKVIGGMQRGFARQPLDRLHSWMSAPQKPQNGATGFMAGGFLLTAFLYWLRIRLVSFPLHPVGYAISGTWSMELVWMPLFLAWCCKAALFRYGGFSAYKKAIPLFLGLIIGDFVSGAIWNLLGLCFGWQVYHFLG